MKKNKALTAAISVLSLTMVSLCAIGGTFAKYTTNGTGQDTAKVAKWGVTVSVTADTAEKTTDTLGGDEEHVVTGTAEESIIAPGTKGNLLSVTVTGSPEVSVTITHTPTINFTGEWEIDVDKNPATDDEFYCPITFTVDVTEVNGKDYIGDKAGLIDKLGQLITANDATNAVIGSSINNAYSISWVWAIGTTEYDDRLDSELGSYTTNAPSFSFTVETKVTQVD